MQLEAMLDLHGLTQAAAFDTLRRFIEQSRRQDKRCLLVITGKSGVLRREAPRWLEQMQPAVLSVASAEPRDGGDGALYVLLRRRR